MQTKGDLRISQEEYISIVEINREPNNHFDYQLISDIADVYEDLDNQKDCRVIVLCSVGKHFCAGADFGKDRDMHDKKDPYEELYKQAVRLFKTKKPVIAAVQGGAIGGGLGLALSADFRVGCEESRFSANFAKLGFHQGFGTSVTLPRIVGVQHSLDMLLTARRVKGIEALEMGLIDRLVNIEKVRSESISMAKEITSSAPLAVESIRETLRHGLADKVEKIVGHELEEQMRLQKTSDFKEGVKSTLERREGNFKGE
tara:strand:- start:219 stop:992 length:774 start_codon:yes stop_codon:yes gene_type:complete